MKSIKVVFSSLLLIICVLLLLTTSQCEARHFHKERWYQQRWCDRHGGKTEIVLNDGSRCDCITNEYAIEVDFAGKWHEAIGQALHYAAKTGLKPGILLIIEKESDWLKFYDMQSVLIIMDVPIKIWAIMEK